MKFLFPDQIEVDKIPAGFRMCYDDNGVLLESAYEIRDSILGLNKTVDNLRKEADRNKKGANETLTEVNALLEAHGVDSVEALGTHIEGLNEAVTKGSKINPDKLRQEVEEGFKKQITTLNEENASLKGVMKETLMGRDVAQAIAKHQGNSDLLSPFVRSRLAMVEEGGKMHVRVTDNDGDYMGDGKGGWLSVEAFVGSLREQPTFHGAFQGREAGGGGTPPNSQQRSYQPRESGQPKSASQKIADGLRQRGFGVQYTRQAGASTPPGME